MVFPNCVRNGFATIMIDFSYLISKLNKSPGTPERPFSDEGKELYHKYWFKIIIK